MQTIRILSLLLLVVATLKAQQITGPGWFAAKREPGELDLNRIIETEPSDEENDIELLSLVSPPEIAEAITPEIEALARGLENDPKRIFDYVHDNIRYVHYFGSKKGAQLTWLERAGNDFDQCALLVALLRAAGHTANYKFDVIAVRYEAPNQADFKNWLGLSQPKTNLAEALGFANQLSANRGFPLRDVGFDQFGNEYVLRNHVWVQLSWNNQTYDLDPSFKVVDKVAGIDLGAAMKLSTSDLMTAAGGTATGYYVENLSVGGLRNKLRDYTTNLLAYIQSNHPNASVEEIVGGQVIRSSAGKSFEDLAAEWPFSEAGGYPAYSWTHIPTNFMASLNIDVAGTNKFLLMPELQGKKLSLRIGSAGVARLYLDDDLLLEKPTLAPTMDVTLSVNHPFGTWSGNTLVDGTFADHATTTSYQTTNSHYVITYAFEADSRWLRQRQQQLDRYRQQGFSDTSREVVSETLNVMGLTWMVQTELINRLLAPDHDMLLQNHHRFGRMGQEPGRGYYIDVYQQLTGLEPASNADQANRFERFFDWSSFMASAAEHGLIEQLQATGLEAASTVKMLQRANAGLQRTFLANSNNWTAGVNIRSQLTNYTTAALNSFGSRINSGSQVLLPQNGKTTVAGSGTWAGYGAVVKRSANGEWEIQMLIDGGYNGGFVSDPNASADPGVVADTGSLQPWVYNPAPPYVPPVYGADPVSMVDGSFHLTTTDLSLGGTEPRGLNFSRHYSSSRRFSSVGGMANGWIHNYHCRAKQVAAPEAGLGTTTPEQAATMIVASKAALELYDHTSGPKNWVVTGLIAKWGIDQLNTNGVSVTLGKDTLQFVRQPDGTFTPPAGCNMTLTPSGAGFHLSERHGRTFKFGSSGRLTNIVDQYNQGLTLTYNSSNWVTTVKDWKNRQFTFTYSGTPSRLTSLTDGTRTVSFGYTTVSGELLHTSFTDAENKSTTYLFDTNHQMLATKDALNRVVVTNIYDSFGRVIEQRSQGDPNQTWRLYWGDTVTVEEDPTGARKRYFYDNKYRLIATEDAIGRRTHHWYDGQDHKTGIMTPLFEVTDFFYDGRHNLVRIWDAIGENQYFEYDSQDRRIRSIDQRGNTNYFGYNAKHQLTGTTNAVGDWATSVYDATDGTLTSTTDAGGTTTFSYDAMGQLKEITYPDGLGVERITYNSFGDVASRTNARGFVSAFEYNRRRELTNSIAPTNVTSKVSFDSVGNVHSITDPRGLAITNVWSPTKKLLATIHPVTPQGVPVVTNVYDRRDWLARTIDPLQQAVVYTNDAAQQLLSVTDPLSRTTLMEYDGVGRLIATTNAAGEVTRQVWNARGELLQVTDPANQVVRRAYDEAGNQTLLTNRNVKKWQFQFDAANRLTNTVSPLGRETSQGYNNRGLLSWVTEPSDDTATLLYDARGRMTNRTDDVGSIAYRYDANGNRTEVSEGSETNSWTFDAYDRVSTYTDAEGNLIQYRYDQSGNLTNLIYPGGKTVTYFYDSLNRLTNVTDWANRKTTFSYDLASRLTSMTRPNGTVREIRHDGAGQVTNIVERTGNNLPIAFFQMNWNNAGRMAWEFAAPLSQPAALPARAMTYDDDNQIATFNGTNVTYDLDGNLTSGPLTNDTFASYFYNERNQLEETVTGTQVVSYGYDATGSRTMVAVNGQTNQFIINPNAGLSQALIRTKPDGSKTFYVYGMGLLYEVSESPAGVELNTRTYHYDYRGSTAALTDDFGTVTDRVEYSAYGSMTHRAGSTDTPFLYNGRYGVMTDANGLLYMRARFYNPYLCRFLNPDPAGFSGGLNLFAYADGNPVSLFDPFGLGPIDHVDTSSWVIPRDNPCIMCHGVSASGFNGNPTSFSGLSTLPGSGPLAREGYSEIRFFTEFTFMVATSFMGPAEMAMGKMLGPKLPPVGRFQSADPLVANLAEKIDSLYPGHVQGVNVPLYNSSGKLVTDADILLRNAVVQVKSGQGAQGLAGQLQRSEAATGLPAIGYGPNLPANSIRTLSSQGALVTKDEALLLQVLKP